MTEGRLFEIEIVITLACFAVAYFALSEHNLAGSRAVRIFAKIAANQPLAICIAALAPVALRLILLPALPVPNPIIPEEFAHIFQADTFLAGRLANPPHPMGRHLETLMELMTPTYSSYRPPGYGALMAVGQFVFGHPWAGVCIAVAGFCAALCWMLQGWISPAWAFSGALLTGMWWCVFGFWMNSYWGGAPAAMGGCLVFGAYPRIKASLGIKGSLGFRAVIAFCAGLAMLANTRIYEGMFVIAPVTVALLLALIRNSKFRWSRKLTHVVLPIAISVGLIAAWGLYYNWRITGHPLVAPYMLGRQRYNMAPPFIFDKADYSVHYNFKILRRFGLWELRTFWDITTVGGFLTQSFIKVFEFWRLYIRPEVTLPLLCIPALIRRPDLRLPLAVMVLALAGLSIETWSPPYYYAPVLGVVVLMILESLKATSSWKFAGKPAGALFARSIALACIATICLLTGMAAMKKPVTKQFAFLFFGNEHDLDHRAAVIKRLEGMPGRHLVLVKFEPTHNYLRDWVFNSADIDRSKIVWAREMNAKDDTELLQYYSDRQVWMLNADSDPLELVPVRLPRSSGDLAETSPPQPVITIAVPDAVKPVWVPPPD